MKHSFWHNNHDHSVWRGGDSVCSSYELMRGCPLILTTLKICQEFRSSNLHEDDGKSAPLSREHHVESG